MRSVFVWAVLGTLALVPGLGCDKSPAPGAASTMAGAESGTVVEKAKVAINSGGSTFINPLMSKWSSEYQKVAQNVEINYQSIGSGGGIRQLIARTVQFGATDAPMTEDQLREAKSPVIHVPLVMGAVVTTYNLPTMDHAVRFTPDVLAGIFLGTIKTWNDPKLAAINPALKLPATAIVIVHRSDGSGTSFVFTDYLSKVSPEWKSKVGSATSVNWPIGIGGRGNEGVAGTVRQTPGAIGYVELTYAIQNKMPAGEVKNRAGQFVSPGIDAVTAAAAGAIATIPDDLRYSITDAPGEKAWPISGTTWAVVYQDMAAGPERASVISFLRWALHDGQKFCAALDYAPLPAELVARAEAKLNLVEPAGK
jgi:phosphate transport system substrate-binding protein